ncbi:MAG: tripartite tricarboxylate transporter TctB family protein [Rhodospirillaceae bacterium]|jgi:MFS family permease
MAILRNTDFLTALVLLVIGLIFSSDGGDDNKDWAFPLLATYVVFAAAVAFFAKFAFNAMSGRFADLIDFDEDRKLAAKDVFVFLVVVLIYMSIMRTIGFWPTSVVMLLVLSVYLTLEKTRQNMTSAILAPIATCIIAYLIFTHVFYVPFPLGTIWPD